MRNIVYAFLLVTGLFTFASCSNDSDTDAPSIEIQEPDENQVFKTGKILKMRFNFKDDYGVRYYSYEIFHDTPDIPGEFTYFKNYEFNYPANEFEVAQSITIPKVNKDSIPTATGNYTLRVIAVDWYNHQSVIDRPIVIEENDEN